MSLPAIVELGAGHGGYCRHLVAGAPGRVWAYDTFDGEFPLQTVGDGENPDHFASRVAHSNSTVRASLEALGVKCVVGVFPESFHAEHPESVSFVHVDMDTYMATKAALELFHPLMVDGGVFMIHDYNNWGMPGVKRAVDEFPHAHLYEHVKDYEDHYRMTRVRQ